MNCQEKSELALQWKNNAKVGHYVLNDKVKIIHFFEEQ